MFYFGGKRVGGFLVFFFCKWLFARFFLTRETSLLIFLKLFSSQTLNQLLLFQSLEATAGHEGTGTSRSFVQTFVHLCNM